MRLSRGITAVIAGLGVFASLPSCSQTANVTDVWMSIDSDGTRRRSVFFTDSKQILCFAEFGNGRDDVTLEMVLRAVQVYVPEQGTTIDINRVVSYLETKPTKTVGGDPGRTSVTFVPLGPDGKPAANEPFPAGRYQCEVYLDGEEKGRSVFNIQHPPCPTVTIIPNQACKFYQIGRQCPLNGNTGTPAPTCSCINQVWQC